MNAERGAGSAELEAPENKSSSRVVLVVPDLKDDERRVRVTIDFEKDDALPSPHERPFWVADDEVGSREDAMRRIAEAIAEVWFYGPEEFERK